MDFEIKFYEGVLEKTENFTEALSVLGDLYTKRGLTEKGLAIDQKLAKLLPTEPIVLYNLACSYSLTDRIEEALRAIKRAIECGYNDFDFMEKDDDLIKLRKDHRYKEFLMTMPQNKQDNDQKKVP